MLQRWNYSGRSYSWSCNRHRRVCMGCAVWSIPWEYHYTTPGGYTMRIQIQIPDRFQRHRFYRLHQENDSTYPWSRNGFFERDIFSFFRQFSS